MKSGITIAGARTRLLGALVLAALSLGLVAGSAVADPWLSEATMMAAPNHETFVYDPGHVYIDRTELLSSPLAGYYDGIGFDRNFRLWAGVARLDVATAADWSGCVDAVHPQPCPVGDLHYAPVIDAIATGTITTIEWRGAYIALACGNFTRGGKAGPVPTVSGVKYEDLNANGQRDVGEPGLSGWTMHLEYEGSVVDTTTTRADGSYEFKLDADHLPAIGAGTYQVVEEQQTGWHASQAPAAFSVGLGAGDTAYNGKDFGNYRNATISGHKFDDGNVDGLWGGSEPGLADWTIQLSNGDDQATAADGAYAFSVRPGTYSVNELLQTGWRQTSPGGDGTRSYTVTSGQVVSGADFGNVCLGGAAVAPVDDSTGDPLAGMEVRIDEVSVPGILANDPSLPRTTTGTPTFGDLLPGTYRITAFLPDGVFTTDPDAVVVDGRFAIVKQIAVQECETTGVPLHLFTQSTPGGKVTGGVKIALGGPSAVVVGGAPGFATSGFEFMGRADGARGTLEYQDHRSGGPNLHTSTIEAVHVDGDVAFVWGRVTVDGTPQRFRLRLVDAGEPGTNDHYELTLATGYAAGFDETLLGGNVQIHA